MFLLKLINGLFSNDAKRKVLEANQTRIMNLQQTFEFIQNIEQISKFTNISVTMKSDTSVLDHISDINYLYKNKPKAKNAHIVEVIIKRINAQHMENSATNAKNDPFCLTVQN